jgi:predicted DNA-binding protein (MmcQ/YjbR family)
MVPDISQISGITDFTVKKEKNRELYCKGEQVFLVVNNNTIELRCDAKLGNLLKEKYESVMESRYFGRGGIEIVLANQLEDQEIADLIRLSYNLA